MAEEEGINAQVPELLASLIINAQEAGEVNTPAPVFL